MKVNPNSSIPLKAIAYIYKSKQNFAQALIFFEKLEKIEPKNIEILSDLGAIQLLLGKTQAGVKTLKTILSIDPKNMMALMLMLKLQEEKLI